MRTGQTETGKMQGVQEYRNRSTQMGAPSEPCVGSASDAKGRAPQMVNVRVLEWELPLEVLQARYTTFWFPMHAHIEYTIAQVTEGAEVFSHRGTQREAPQDATIHLNPSESHNGRAAG